MSFSVNLHLFVAAKCFQLTQSNASSWLYCWAKAKSPFWFDLNQISDYFFCCCWQKNQLAHPGMMPVIEGVIKPFAVIGLWGNWAGGCQASHQSLPREGTAPKIQGCPQVVWLGDQTHFCWLQHWKHLIFCLYSLICTNHRKILFLLQEGNCFPPSPKY